MCSIVRGIVGVTQCTAQSSENTISAISLYLCDDSYFHAGETTAYSKIYVLSSTSGGSMCQKASTEVRNSCSAWERESIWCSGA
jgi:hypothetical protein